MKIYGLVATLYFLVFGLVMSKLVNHTGRLDATHKHDGQKVIVKSATTGERLRTNIVHIVKRRRKCQKRNDRKLQFKEVEDNIDINTLQKSVSSYKSVDIRLNVFLTFA